MMPISNDELAIYVKRATEKLDPSYVTSHSFAEYLKSIKAKTRELIVDALSVDELKVDELKETKSRKEALLEERARLNSELESVDRTFKEFYDYRAICQRYQNEKWTPIREQHVKDEEAYEEYQRNLQVYKKEENRLRFDSPDFRKEHPDLKKYMNLREEYQAGANEYAKLLKEQKYLKDMYARVLANAETEKKHPNESDAKLVSISRKIEINTAQIKEFEIILDKLSATLEWNSVWMVPYLTRKKQSFQAAHVELFYRLGISRAIKQKLDEMSVEFNRLLTIKRALQEQHKAALARREDLSCLIKKLEETEKAQLDNLLENLQRSLDQEQVESQIHYLYSLPSLGLSSNAYFEAKPNTKVFQVCAYVNRC